MFFTRVGFLSLILLGGQAPHVLRGHMWALNTCGEPNEIEMTIRVLTDCITDYHMFPGQGRAGAAGVHRPAVRHTERGQLALYWRLPALRSV